MEVRGHAIEGSIARYPAMLDGPVELGLNRTEQVFVKNETSAPFSITEAIPSDRFIASTFPNYCSLLEQGISIFVPYDENPILGELLFKVMHLLQFIRYTQANDCENGTASLYDQDGDGIKRVLMTVMTTIQISLPSN